MVEVSCALFGDVGFCGSLNSDMDWILGHLSLTLVVIREKAHSSDEIIHKRFDVLLSCQEA